MGERHPFNGFASKSDAARDYARRNPHLSADKIAAALGIGSGLVYQALEGKRVPEPARARQAGVMLAPDAGRVEHRDTAPATVRVMELRLPEPLFAALVSEARRRNLTPDQLARRFIAGMLEGRP